MTHKIVISATESIVCPKCDHHFPLDRVNKCSGTEPMVRIRNSSRLSPSRRRNWSRLCLTGKYLVRFGDDHLGQQKTVQSRRENGARGHGPPSSGGDQADRRGAYSMIFRGAGPVFKLTADRVAYELAECQLQWQCASLPMIKALYGEVGATNGGIPLFLMEIEHLKKLAVGTRGAKAMPVHRAAG